MSDVNSKVWEPIVGDDAILAAARADGVLPIPVSDTTTYWVASNATVEMRSTKHDCHVDFRNARGVPHNPYGAAVFLDQGARSFFVDGVRHRVGGPAVETPRADSFEFWDRGRRSNLLGAAIATQGWGEWWVDGHEVGPIREITDVTVLSTAELLEIPPFVPQELRIPGLDVMVYNFEE
jgi:hypothetical protein